jgi:branched-chain amino acid transport system substrate-binding protein
MKQAASIRGFRPKMLLPGITVNTSAKDFYPVEAMQMQRFDGKEWERFGDLVSAESS